MGDIIDIAAELSLLHTLQGAAFSRQVERIALQAGFHILPGEDNIMVTDIMHDDDFPNLLTAARKAASHGFKVYILPNPKSTRTADLILERKGLFKMYDLKTIQGKSSAINRLQWTSVGIRYQSLFWRESECQRGDDIQRQQNDSG